MWFLCLIRHMCVVLTLRLTGSVVLLCVRPVFSLQCCVFPAAVVLLDFWDVLLRNIWDEHLNHSLIRDIKQTLDKIIRRNKNAEVDLSLPNPIKYALMIRFPLPTIFALTLRFCPLPCPQRFQEEMNPAQFPRQPSSPEELLGLTSELFSRWLEVGCLPSIETCPLPSLHPYVERKDYGPSRARLLTTRGLSDEGKGLSEKMIGMTPSSGAAPPWTSRPLVWSPLLLGLSGWLLP